MGYESISSFLNDVKNTKDTFKYKCGNDFEVLRYIETNEKGNDVYFFSQFEKEGEEPFFEDCILDYEITQILSNGLMFRDFKNAVKLN